MSDPPIWDERFAEPGYAYGTEPNDFLREVASRIPPGPVLSLGEGEGRNAVFLAGLGHSVTALDASAVGLAKAGALARQRGVRVVTVRADVTKYVIGTAVWSGIVSLWLHLPPAVRAPLHRACVAGLAPGGAFVLEAYAPRQLDFGTGGPRDEARLATLAALRVKLDGLDLEIARELDRDINEGRYHEGRGAVVQVLGRKS